jgi:hypothetical protein
LILKIYRKIKKNKKEKKKKKRGGKSFLFVCKNFNVYVSGRLKSFRKKYGLNYFTT